MNLFDEVEESINNKKQPTELAKAQKQLQEEEREKNKIEVSLLNFFPTQCEVEIRLLHFLELQLQ